MRSATELSKSSSNTRRNVNIYVPQYFAIFLGNQYERRSSIILRLRKGRPRKWMCLRRYPILNNDHESDGDEDNDYF